MRDTNKCYWCGQTDEDHCVVNDYQCPGCRRPSVWEGYDWNTMHPEGTNGSTHLFTLKKPRYFKEAHGMFEEIGAEEFELEQRRENDNE